MRADLDPEAEATVFVGMLRGVAMQWIADHAFLGSEVMDDQPGGDTGGCGDGPDARAIDAVGCKLGNRRISDFGEGAAIVS